MVFEPRKSHVSPFSYDGANIEQVDIFEYLGITMHGTRGISTALETLCQATTRATFGLLRRCQQLHILDPIVKCRLFDTLVKPILCYGCEIWSITGGKNALAELERAQIGFLKMLLGVQTHTKTLHVLAEFGKSYHLHHSVRVRLVQGDGFLHVRQAWQTSGKSCQQHRKTWL